MNLFAHIIDGLSKNHSMNQLDNWFDGLSSAQEVVDIYSESFDSDVTSEEMDFTLEALQLMIDHNVNDIECAAAQTAIKNWNKNVYGQDFVRGEISVPFRG